MTLTKEQLEQYRKSPIWQAALEHVIEKVRSMTTEDLDTNQPYKSGFDSATYELDEWLGDELEEVDLYAPPANIQGEFYEPV